DLAYPAFAGGELAAADHAVVGGAFGSLEFDSEDVFPDPAHAFGGVAAPAFAVAVLAEDRRADLRKVALVEPGSAGGHDVIAIVEHETVAVRVAEVVEGRDRAARASVERRNQGGAAIDPDQRGAA